MIGAIIQARTGSTRLPNKVLREVLGQPLLHYLVERLQVCVQLDQVVVATTTGIADDAIEALCARLGVACVRGSDADVLTRYCQAASQHRLTHVVRVSADCPLIDPEVVDRVIDRYRQLLLDIDYVSNVLPPTYPDGLDVEVFSRETLRRLDVASSRKYEREHVTTYLHENPRLFRIANVAGDEDLSHHRWTVDNVEDFELVRQILEALYPVKRRFGFRDVLTLLAARPELGELNRHVPRDEGFVRSLEGQGLAREEKEEIIRRVLPYRRTKR